MEKQIQKPLGIIDALYCGFELVFCHPWILILPIVLDMFLWVGPQLTATPVFQNLLALVSASPPPNATPEMIQNIETLKQSWAADGGSFNVFSILAFAAIGMPTLIAALPPSVSPFPAPPQTYSVSSGTAFLGLFAILTVAGVLFGSVYLELIALGIRRETSHPSAFALRTLKSYLMVGALIVFGAVAAVLVMIPFVLSATVVALFDQTVASFLFLLGLMLLMWAALYLSFAVPAIFVSGASPWQAVVSSVAVMRYNFWSAMGLLFLVIVIEQGFLVIWEKLLNNVWSVIGADVANAVLGSALIAALMLFYQDRITFLMRVRELFQQQQKLS